MRTLPAIRRPRTRRATAVVTALLAGAAVSLVPVGGASASTPAFCSLGIAEKYVWVGGVSTHWDDAGNWLHNGVPSSVAPGDWLAPTTDYVCVPANKTVLLPPQGGSVWASLLAIDIAKGSTVTVDIGSKLFVEGNQSTQPSLVRSGANLTVRGSTLGGRGKITISGTMDWLSTTMGAATQTVRDCDLGGTCPGALTGVIGRTVIGSTGALNVSTLGVNFEDKRIIENHGVTTLSGGGYIGADYGTAFRNVGTGSFRITNDQGYFQGRKLYGISTRSLFLNTGLIEKSGTGTSVIDAKYSEGASGAGTIVILSGSLSILSSDSGQAAANQATVKQGSAFGLGGCDAAATTCTTPVATPSDNQTESVALPPIGTTSATVSFEELTAEKTAAMRTAPTHIQTPGAVASTTAPMRFTFVLDSSLKHAGETANGLSQTLVVSRKGDTDPSYAVVPNCGASGNPTAAAPSCVNRPDSATETSAAGNGDVVLVVRTTQNSRWIVG